MAGCDFGDHSNVFTAVKEPACGESTQTFGTSALKETWRQRRAWPIWLQVVIHTVRITWTVPLLIGFFTIVSAETTTAGSALKALESTSFPKLQLYTHHDFQKRQNRE